MVTPFECYQDYVALKRHFASRGYDYQKYSGKVTATADSFENRPDKSFFLRVAKMKNPSGFLLANMVENKDSWVGDLAFSQDAEAIYKQWIAKQESLTYIFKNDLLKLNEVFNDNFKIINNGLPLILKLYLQKKIQFETVCILFEILNLKKKWVDKIKDPLYNDMELKIEKYLPFLKFDRNQLKKILKDQFHK